VRRASCFVSRTLIVQGWLAGLLQQANIRAFLFHDGIDKVAVLLNGFISWDTIPTRNGKVVAQTLCKASAVDTDLRVRIDLKAFVQNARY